MSVGAKHHSSAIQLPTDPPPDTSGRWCDSLNRARTRRCRHAAGFRTDHPGQGRCYLHGGRNPTKHGRYSQLKHPTIRELIDKHSADPDPLNILPELAALRALFENYIDRYELTTNALLAWHASFGLTQRPLPEPLVMAFANIVDDMEESYRAGGPEMTDRQVSDLASARKFLAMLRGAGSNEERPRMVLDIADAHRILAEIGKMVERIEKIRSVQSISRTVLEAIMQAMWRSVDARITDEDVKRQIAADWQENLVLGNLSK